MSNSFYHERYCQSATGNNRTAVTCSQVDRTPRIESINGIQCYFVDIIFRSRVARFATSGNWNSIYHKFRRWCADEVFEIILQALVANTEKYLLVEIDLTFCKVHQHAAGARKKYGNQAIGVSRGDKNTKIHALITENFQLIGLTGEHVHDSECATEE